MSSNPFKKIQRSLQPFSKAKYLQSLDLSIEKKGLVISVHFQLEGDLKKLVLPELCSPPYARADELWKHTCLEFFIKLKGTEYLEFNFSPAGNWNCYHFKNYREGMTQTNIVKLISLVSSRTQTTQDSSVDLYDISIHLELIEDIKPYAIGGTAVIESLDGEIQYWALQHSGEKPDFHQFSDWITL